MRISRVLTFFLGVLAIASCFHMEAGSTTTHTPKMKDEIEDALGLTIVRAVDNVGETHPAVVQAMELRAFFHDSFCDAGSTCSAETCIPIVVETTTLKTTPRALIEWKQEPEEGLYVHASFDADEGFGAFKAFHEIFHAWQKHTGRYDIPASNGTITTDMRFPWEDEVFGWLSAFVDTVTDGRYQPFINTIATEVLRREREVVQPEVVIYTEFPDRLYNFYGQGTYEPSRLSRYYILDLATIDLNRAVIAMTSTSDGEHEQRRSSLLAHYAIESNSPDVHELWKDQLQ